MINAGDTSFILISTALVFLMTPATKTVNPTGADGLLYGNPAQLGIQAIGVLTTMTIAMLATLVILKVVGIFTKLRATENDEEIGLDLSQHGEEAYPDFVGSTLVTVPYTPIHHSALSSAFHGDHA